MKIKFILLSIIHIFGTQTQSLFASHNHEIYNVPGHYDVNSIPGHHDVNFSNNPSNQQWHTTASDLVQCLSQISNASNSSKNDYQATWDSAMKNWNTFMLEFDEKEKHKAQRIINELSDKATMMARSDCWFRYHVSRNLSSDDAIPSASIQLCSLYFDYPISDFQTIDKELQTNSGMTIHQMLLTKYKEEYETTATPIRQQEFERKQKEFAREMEAGKRIAIHRQANIEEQRKKQEENINYAIGILSQRATNQGSNDCKNLFKNRSPQSLRFQIFKSLAFSKSLLEAVEIELQTSSQMSLDQMLQEFYENGYKWEQGKTLRQQNFNKQHKLHEAAMQRLYQAHLNETNETQSKNQVQSKK